MFLSKVIENQYIAGNYTFTGSVIYNEETTDDTFTFYVNGASPFGDVSPSHPQYSYIMTLYNAGYTAGCSTDPILFCPDTVMDRSMAAVFMLRGQFGADYVPTDSAGIFSDDWTPGPWAEKWSEAMYTEGLSGGCSSDPLMYCPWTTLTRQEASVFGLRMMYGMSYSPPAASGTLFADMDQQRILGNKMG